jgi:hypothetical protein
VPVPELNPPTIETFEFVYQGPDVDNGTMDVRELSEVLSGVSRAFSTVAYEADLGDEYQLRIRDVEASSFHIIFEAIAYAKANPAAATAITAGAAVALQALTNVASGAYRIITDIVKAIDVKKRLKGAKVATLPTSFNEGEVVLNAPDDLIVLTREQYELLLSQRIDKPLSQIVSPLEHNRIESFEVRRSKLELVRVEARQRSYFDYVEVAEEKSKEGTQIDGTLNSLSKNTLKGTFYTVEGVHVPYKYVGGDVAQLLRGFTARERVRVHGKVKFGTDNVPRYIEVEDIDILQRGIFENGDGASGASGAPPSTPQPPDMPGSGRKFKPEI